MASKIPGVAQCDKCEDPKARLFVNKGGDAQGLDELSRDLWFWV